MRAHPAHAAIGTCKSGLSVVKGLRGASIPSCHAEDLGSNSVCGDARGGLHME